MPTKPLGDRGEDIAARFLGRAGWSILHRNFRVGRKEIDLVVRRGEVVAFVEVKTRGGLAFGHPFESITRPKQLGISEVAGAWIRRYGAPDDEYRFDAVAVLLTPGSVPVVEHIENAWSS